MLSGGEHCTCLHCDMPGAVGGETVAHTTRLSPNISRETPPTNTTDKRRESTKDIFRCLFYLKHYQRQIAISTANNICSLIHSLGQATHSTFAVIFILGLAQLDG